MDATTHREILQLFDDYLRMYAARDDRLTSHFSTDFSGFTGGGDFLVKDRAEGGAITRQDFSQVKDPIQIELKDVAVQSLADTVAVACGFFTIRLPIKDHVLSRETARLVLVFRREPDGWKICHSSISIPYHLVRPGEVYPLQELTERNRFLEELVAERTTQLSTANESLRQIIEELKRENAERRQTDLALLRSEERYRSILNASPDDITITDAEGRIVMVSPMALTIFRHRGPDGFRGRHVIEFIVPEDRERALRQVAQKRRGEVTGPTEYRGLRPDGSTFDIEVNSDFIRDANREPTGMVVIVRDITERKQAEAEREKLADQNRQLQKSESLGRMAEAIAHHFNNQLHAVIMSVELAMDELPASGGARASLLQAIQSAQKAAEVSTLMLTYLGHSLGQRRPTDLSVTCQDVLSLLRAAMPVNVDLHTDLPVPGPTIEAKPNQLHQALSNLLTNAWEAAGEGPSVIRLAVKTVSTSEIPVMHRHPVDWQPQAADYACLEVADEGCGIAPTDFEKLFDPFFSTKFTGRGLGLAVVLGVAREHGGVVTVESRLGHGSAFRIFLPLSSAAVPVPAAPGRPGPVAERTAGAHPFTILVVDDEPIVRQTIRLALAQAGYVALSAEDGVEAVALFREGRHQIDCVLCDLTMPNLGGWETLAALRQSSPGLPFILASGFSEAQVLAGDHAERPQAFLQKPYDLRSLIRTIDRVMASAKARGTSGP